MCQKKLRNVLISAGVILRPFLLALTAVLLLFPILAFAASSDIPTSGSAQRISVSVFPSCAGRESIIQVAYYVVPPQESKVEIFRIRPEQNVRVYSEKLTGPATLYFTASAPGNYELRAHMENEQKTASFAVADCGLLEKPGVGAGGTVELEAGRTLEFSRTQDFENGFSRRFSVYREDGAPSGYTTEITVTYRNGGPALRNFAFREGVPREVVERSSQVSFKDYPKTISSDGQLEFEWGSESLESGESVSFAYSISRPMTPAMMEKFGSPRTVTQGPAGIPDIGDSDLFASLVGAELFDIQLSHILIGLFVLVLLFLVYKFMSGRSKED